MVNIELAGEAGGRIAILHAELAPGAVAVGVHRGLGHAEFARDLLGRQVLIDQAQAFALAGRKQPHRVFGNDVARDHSASS
jgi:hypothetical protein